MAQTAVDFDFKSTHDKFGTPPIAMLGAYFASTGSFELARWMKWLIEDAGADLYSVAPSSSEPFDVSVPAVESKQGLTYPVNTREKSFVSVLLNLRRDLEQLALDDLRWDECLLKTEAMLEQVKLYARAAGQPNQVRVPEAVVQMWSQLAFIAEYEGDIGILTEEGTVRVHSAVLEQASPTLASMLKEANFSRSRSAPMIEIPVRAGKRAVSIIVHLIYTGMLPESCESVATMEAVRELCISWGLPFDIAGLLPEKAAPRARPRSAPRPPSPRRGGGGPSPRRVALRQTFSWDEARPRSPAPHRRPDGVDHEILGHNQEAQKSLPWPHRKPDSSKIRQLGHSTGAEKRHSVSPHRRPERFEKFGHLGHSRGAENKPCASPHRWPERYGELHFDQGREASPGFHQRGVQAFLGHPEAGRYRNPPVSPHRPPETNKPPFFHD